MMKDVPKVLVNLGNTCDRQRKSEELADVSVKIVGDAEIFFQTVSGLFKKRENTPEVLVSLDKDEQRNNNLWW